MNSKEKIKLEMAKEDIYKKYPIIIPFIGENYDNMLFIGESHYLPNPHGINESWYKMEMKDHNFSELDKEYLNTNQIIQTIVIESNNKNKPHSMYRNYGDVYGEVFDKGTYKTALTHTAYYNYFLRPAEIPGKSIMANWNDKLISYNHLIRMDEILKPTKIIFLSSMARQSFHQVFHSKEGNPVTDEFISKIEVVQHPTSAWWNRASKKNDGRTGRQQLSYILKNSK